MSQKGPKGTTPEAQAIFDALVKTYKVEWQGTTILLNDNVVIEKPYEPGNCKYIGDESSAGAKGGLERVRKIVEMERHKAELRQSQSKLGEVKAAKALVKGG